MELIRHSGHMGQPSGCLPGKETLLVRPIMYIIRPFASVYLSTLQLLLLAASGKLLSCAE